MKLPSFLRDSRGAALIEFLFVFPFVALLMFGAIEMARYVLIAQKVEKSGYVLGDTLSQTTPEELTMGTLDNIFKQYTTIMSPYGSLGRQAVVLSSVKKDLIDKKIKIMWQHAGGGNLRNLETVSIVSGRNIDAINSTVIGTEAQFTGALASELRTMIDGENMIVAEVFFQFDPALQSVLSATTKPSFSIGSRTLVRRTYFHPRNGDLDKIVGQKACTLPWGGTIEDGEYVTAWQSMSAPPCPGCMSQVRVCNNGVLSGTYGNKDCTLNWSGITTQVCDSQFDATENSCEAGGGTFQKGPAVTSSACSASSSSSSGGGSCPSFRCARPGGVGKCCQGVPDEPDYTNCTVNCLWQPNTTQCQNGPCNFNYPPTAGSGGPGHYYACCGGSTSGGSAPCGVVSKTWTGGTSCTQSTVAATHGAVQNLIVSTAGTNGLCQASCNNGIWSACAPGYYCDVVSSSSTSGGTSASSTGSSGGGCFTAETLILMADGSHKPISQVKKGDVVRGRDGNNHVTAVYIHVSDEPIYAINGGAAFITGEHPIWTPQGWKSMDPALTHKESLREMRTQSLTIGDTMLGEDGSAIRVESIEGEQQGPYKVYNLHLDGDHTYFANDILVHNIMQKR